MASAVGLNAQVAIAKEVTWGTANTTWTNWMEYVRCGFQSNENVVPRPHLGVDGGGGLKASFVGDVIAGGELVVEMKYDGIGVLLDAAMGTSSSTGVGPYTHTYDPNSTTALDGYTIRNLRGQSTEETFEGGKVDTWAIRGSAGNPLLLATTWSFQKSGETRAAFGTTSTTLVDNNIVKPDHAGTISWNGNTFTLLDFELTGDNKLAKRTRMGSQYIAEQCVAGRRLWKLKATIEVEDTNLFDDWVANTIANLTQTYTGSGNDSFIIDADNAQLVAYSDTIDGEGIITAKCEWQLHADSSDPGLQIQLVNDATSATSNGG